MSVWQGNRKLVSIRTKIPTLHSTHLICYPKQKLGNVEHAAAAFQSKPAVGKPKFSVIRNGKPAYLFKANYWIRGGQFFDEKNNRVAQMSSEFWQHENANTFHIRCAPGTDTLLVLLASLLYDKIKDSQSKNHQ
jgi:hypothetical protein